MFVVKVPGINGFGKTKGCEEAGNEILNVLKKEIHSNESGKIIEFGSLDIEEIHLDNSNLELTNKLIYENAFESFDKNKVVFLGGDHSISYSLTRAFFDYNQNSGKESCLIIFDAHADLTNFPNQRFSDNRNWLKKLIKDGFPTENILLVGARNLDKTEIEFIRNNQIKIISMNQLLENLSDSCEIIMEFANRKELYFSFDMSVVDSAFAPATDSPESGGLSSREIIYLISRIKKMKNLKAVDIVEINSEKDRDKLTIKLGAKILGELI